METHAGMSMTHHNQLTMDQPTPWKILAEASFIPFLYGLNYRVSFEGGQAVISHFDK